MDVQWIISFTIRCVRLALSTQNKFIYYTHPSALAMALNEENTAGAAAPEAAASEPEASLLVSEFPPPPFYYRQAAALTPPPIPVAALERGTRRAAAAAARARAQAERNRLGLDEIDKTDAILGGVTAEKVEEEDDGEVVAVFGEIVEDPLLVEPLDHCEDPKFIRDQVQELNKKVLQGFVRLVQDLVHRPTENKYVIAQRTAKSLKLDSLLGSEFLLTKKYHVISCCHSLLLGKRETNCRIIFFSCCRNATNFENTKPARL